MGAVRGCPLCGDPTAACGTTTHVVPLDVPHYQERTAGMPLREYQVTVNGHTTTMSLTEADAATLGGVPIDAPAPAEAVAEKVRPVANKARTAHDKTP